MLLDILNEIKYFFVKIDLILCEIYVVIAPFGAIIEKARNSFPVERIEDSPYRGW